MKNTALEQRICDEMLMMMQQHKSLHLASLDSNGQPYASYAPFAPGDDCFYVLLSDIALHGINLQLNPQASILIIEDEKTAAELFARVRINYRVLAAQAKFDTPEWHTGIAALQQRHGDRIKNLSGLADFRLFRLTPQSGRFVKGFGKAYSFSGQGFFGDTIDHLRDGHQQRAG